MILLRWLTFLLISLIVTPRVLLFWISFFLATVVFVIQWITLYWDILIMLLPQFPLTFRHSLKEMPVSFHSLWLFLCLFGWSSWSFERCSMVDIFNSVLLLLLVKLGSSFRLELLYISFIVNIRPSLTLLHGFQVFEVLQYFIEITFFVSTKRINLLSLKENSYRLVFIA